LEPGAAVVDGQPRPEAPRAPTTDHEMLIEIYQLLTSPVPSRSIYRDNNQPVDIWRGMLLNIDGMAHEAYVEREALLGYEPAIATIRRCAENSDHPQARRRAAFILSKIAERAQGGPVGNGEVRPHRPPAKKVAKAPAKKAAKASVKKAAAPARKGTGERWKGP